MKNNEVERSIFFINENFLKLWLSQIFSQVASYAMLFFLITQVHIRTSSTIAVYLIWLFYAIPILMVGPFSGIFVDFCDKRKILIIANFLQAVTIFSYLFINKHFYLSYILVFAYSFLNQFYLPTEAASIPWLVKKEKLALANLLFLFTAQGAVVFGFGLSGLLLKFLNPFNFIFLFTILLLIAGISTYLLPIESRAKKIPFGEIPSLFLNEVETGYQFLTQNRLILYSFGLITIFQILSASLITILPSLAESVFRISIYDLAPILISPLVIGSVLGGYIFNRLNGQNRKHRWIKGGLLAIALIIVLTSIIVPSLNRGRTLVSIFLMFLLGISVISIIIPSQTFVQENTPAKFRGRVFGILGFFVTITSLLPVLLIATAVELIGGRNFLLLAGILLSLLALYINKNGERIILSANHRS